MHDRKALCVRPVQSFGRSIPYDPLRLDLRLVSSTGISGPIHSSAASSRNFDGVFLFSMDLNYKL
jgi:hypothetical protein